MLPYQYCSKEECTERQELGQVSELEATVESCLLSQKKRVLDPRIGVSKYRRSAATGGSNSNDGRPIRNREELHWTLSHLTKICATGRATPDHPTITSMDTIVGFVVDRLRACQSDATKLLSNPETSVPSSWHARVIRILIWLRYSYSYAATEDDANANVTANNANINDTTRTIDRMRSTAYDAYWNTVEYWSTVDHSHPDFVGRDNSTPCDDDDDDEMLCYNAITRICAISKLQSATTNYASSSSLETSWNGMLLEFSKRKRHPGCLYPLWNLALKIASHVRRDEYSVLWKTTQSNLVEKLPMLARSIVSGEALLLLGRYRTVQHYNKSFGKGESVTDMNRLLGIAGAEAESSDVAGIGTGGWSIEYANVFGVPVVVEEAKNNNENENSNSATATITMQLKEVPMAEWDSSMVDATTASRIQKSDRLWIFGDNFDDESGSTSPMGISTEVICRLLEFGCGSPVIGIDTISHDTIKNEQSLPTLTSSLSRALVGEKKSSNISNSSSSIIITNNNIKNVESLQTPTSSLSRALLGEKRSSNSNSNVKNAKSSQTPTSSLSRALAAKRKSSNSSGNNSNNNIRNIQSLQNPTTSLSGISRKKKV